MITIVALLTGSILLFFYLGYFLLMLNKSKSPREKCSEYAPSVSVIIPTYNEEATIVHKLQNLMEQNYPMEIIVVDSASQDRTVELIEDFVQENRLKIKILKEKERRGIASAENKAFPYCSGEVMVLSDADSIWEKDALKKAVSNFSDKNIGAVTGKQILLNPNQNIATKFEKNYRSIFEILRTGESILDSTPISDGELLCLRKDLIKDVTVSEDSMADDSELPVKIRKKGFRAIYDPGACFYEYAPPSFKSRFAQKVRRGQGLIQLFLRERGILFNRKYGKFGIIIFPAEFFMHVISPILLFIFLFCFIISLLEISIYLLIGLIFTVAVSSMLLELVGVHIINFFLNFLNLQLTLLLSLVRNVIRKPEYKWKQVSEIRELWKDQEVKPTENVQK